MANSCWLSRAKRWRGRRESDNQVFCHPCMRVMSDGPTHDIYTTSAPPPPPSPLSHLLSFLPPLPSPSPPLSSPSLHPPHTHKQTNTHHHTTTPPHHYTTTSHPTTPPLSPPSSPPPPSLPPFPLPHTHPTTRCHLVQGCSLHCRLPVLLLAPAGGLRC